MDDGQQKSDSDDILSEAQRALDVAFGQRLEELQRAETVSKVAGGVAHDLNNVLTPIISYAELALSDLSQDEVLYYDMEQILEAARYAHGLSRQLLSFCKQQAPALTIVDLNRSIIGSRKMLRRLLREDITMDFHLEEGLDGVIADSSQIDQILINMAVNARDAMPEGGQFTIETAHVELNDAYVERHPDAKAGPKIMLAFRDTGVGMSEDVIARIFERGYSTKNDGGTGLGLSTVKGIVESGGGFIEVVSQPGNGTCFKLFLPRVVGSLKRDAAPAGEPAFYGQGEWVLVLEPDEVQRRVSTRILDHFNYNVLEAETPEQALEVVLQRAGALDLFICPLVMSGMGGESLGRQMIELVPGVRVLYLVGPESQQHNRPEQKDGRVALLDTPVTVQGLARSVWNVLMGRTMG